MSVVSPDMLKDGWTFNKEEGSTGDDVNGKSKLSEIYLLADPKYTGRVSVPVLWDKERKTIVNNELSEIIRMLNSAFDAFTNVRTDYYPQALRAEIDRINDLVYPNINNGVYRAGFATTQEAYEQAFRNVFDALDEIEQICRSSAISSARRSPKPTGGCSRRWSVSTPSIMRTSSATGGTSTNIRICRIMCAISISCRASPRRSAWRRSSGTITAASAK